MPYKDPTKRKAYNDAYRKAHREALLPGKIDWYYANHEQEKTRSKMANRTRRIEDRESVMLYRARERAKDKGIECTITREDIFIPEFCPALKIKLDLDNGVEDRDSSPSLDRFDLTKGYVPGNVHVISFRANRIKNDSTPEELKLVSDWVNGI
jgi:hypothetical protein